MREGCPGVSPFASLTPRNLYFFFFNDTATTEIYTLSLHDALPIWQHAVEDDHIPALAHGHGDALHTIAAHRHLRALLAQAFGDVARVQRVVFDDEIAVHAGGRA